MTLLSKSGKKFLFFLTDTGFWRNREQSSMAKAGRPYFKRYETKITNHDVRIRRFFVRDYIVINSSQLYRHYLFARYTFTTFHYLSLEVIVELHENIFNELALFLLPNSECLFDIYCCYGRINGNVRRVKSNIYCLSIFSIICCYDWKK